MRFRVLYHATWFQNIPEVFSILTRVATQYFYSLSNPITLSKSVYTFKCFLFSTSGAGLKPVLSVSLFNIHIKISASLLARLLARLQESNKFENGDTFIWVAFQQRIIAHEHVQEMVFTPLCPGHLALWLPRFVCKVQRVVKVKRKL